MSAQVARIHIATRRSRLARWQTDHIAARLRAAHPGLTVEIVEVVTKGDEVRDRALSAIGERGLFTRELERVLLAGRADIAVHSLKDMPTELPPGLEIGAVTKREDVRDVFIPRPDAVARTIDELPPGSVIATGSLRRRAQIMSWSKGFEVVDLRGNLATRFSKLEKSDWAGMILARAGVVRLGLADRIGEAIDTARMMPAVGQGALGIEVRSGEPELLSMLSVLVSEATTCSTTAERAFLGKLEGGCKVPIGAYGRIESDTLHLDGLVASLDGKHVYRGKVSGEPGAAALLGVRLAETLLRSGAGKALEGIRR